MTSGAIHIVGLAGFAIAGFLWTAGAEAQTTAALRDAKPASLEAAFVSPVKIPATVRAIVSPSEIDIAQRLRSVHSLPDNLSRGEVDAFYTFIKSAPAPGEKDLPGLYGVKNDLLNVLRQQSTPPANFTGTLLDIYNDPSQDVVMRDYAIQHLVPWYEEGALDMPDARDKIRDVLRRAANETNSIAGTALLGMHRLSATDSNFSSDEINALASTHALSAHVHPATRLTAIQICAERGIKTVLPKIESLPDTSRCLPVRLAAIAAIGQLGGKDNIEALRQLEAGQEPSLMPALGPALRNLKEKEKLEQLY